MQAEAVSQTPAILEFSYTDFYHQDTQYWTSFNISVNLFASEPPIFDNNLTNISISRWSNFDYLLPHITEPDGHNFAVQLSNSTPSWIELINNNTIRVSPIKHQIIQNEVVPVEIVLTDDTNALSKYILNMILLPYSSPQYGNIEAISSDLINGVELNVTSPSPVNSVDWSSGSILLWLYFNTSSSMLMLKDQIPVNTIWCKLWSTDLCGTLMCSNKFNVTQQPTAHNPPVITNTFGPFSIYENYIFVFEVPSDLFYSSDNSLSYSISTPNWNKYNSFTANLSKYNISGQYYLYLSSQFKQVWYLELFATDKYNQTASVTVEVIINACASKDCLKWNGPLQANWTECLYNYKLNDEGKCLQISVYNIENNNDFYSLWGIITMTVLLISVLMSLLFGRKYLLNLSNAQAFLILVFWTNDVDESLKAFASWLQFSKLDFGYLYYSGLNSVFMWTTESTKMANLQFGCHSTVLNYLWILMLIALIVTICKLLNIGKHKIQIVNRIISSVQYLFPSSLIAWVSIHLYYKLILINIVSLDLMMIRNHVLVSVTSIVILVSMIVYFGFKHKLFSKMFVESIDINNSLSFTLTSLIKYTFLGWLLISESTVSQVVWAILYLLWELKILVQQINSQNSNHGNSLFTHFNLNLT